ncbi:hypothetical protein BN1051_00830 [Arthrobacter saudimassiliensis]|uniref:Fibrinogen C-terminal domain-containing protein n=1 Tax=Arthrobacter saudimassiliensis TaxID=1461584 RepID=A0A078MMK0_9MICC|nr:hypothetical protein BN1051_00830 [Arthrobacter saudimassiliensis]
MKARSKWRGQTLVGAATAVCALLGGLAAAPPALSAEAPAPNGATADTAAASCWEIKQEHPQLPSGIYWLLTPAMPQPEQFYCDQSTDGGGWVLIGRGREGWKELYQGVGTPAQVRGSISGTSAFTPRQLSSELIDGLLNNQAPQDLQDGVRLRRALDVSGSTWQEVRYRTRNQPRWSWAIGSATPLAGGQIGDTSFNGGTTSNFGTDQIYQRVVTTEDQTQGWTQGFAYGRQARGENSSTSFIWSSTATAGNPRPFTQMYLRPKVTQADGFQPLPDSGAQAYPRPVQPETNALPTVWGVTGLASGTGELNTEVQAFAQIGTTVYVAGNFRYVQRSSSGSGRIEQPYLAGFDVNSGEMVMSFRPALNGQVKTLAALPNGSLAIGGTFTTLNGERVGAVAAIDSITGTAVPGWQLNMENRISGAVVQVRSLKVHGDWLYVGGAFTHLSGGGSSTTVYARAGARVVASTGRPDAGWNPAFNGTVVDIDPAGNGNRLYAAGYFTTSNTSSTYRAAAVETAPGASVVPWDFVPSSPERAGYQQAIEEVGGRVWVGGAEHLLFSYDTATLTRQSSNITLQGGDFQDISANGSVVYGACHCGHWNYSGAATWPNVGNNFTIADKINLVGAWSADTGEFIPGFNPVMKGRAGYGVWSTFTDSKGVLWAGGDLVSSTSTSGSSQWSGGFARFAAADVTPPSTPGKVAVSHTADVDRLSWAPSSGSLARYHVLREDRVIAVTTATQVTLPTATGNARYFVRAVDAAGNLSATSGAVRGGATPADPPPQAQFYIESGSEWKYRFSNDAPPAGWIDPGFDDSDWARGSAPFGWGSAGLATTLPSLTPRPLSTHYRKTFHVAAGQPPENVTLITRADDGIIVYVNGVEVVRSNMPEGPLTHNSYALTAPNTATAQASPVVVTVPGSLFTAGPNVISAEVHSNYRSTPSSSFELTARSGPAE